MFQLMLAVLLAAISLNGTAVAGDRVGVQPELRVEAARLVVAPDIDGYALAGDVSLTLSTTLREAISRGVPLVFKSEFELLTPRWYWQSRTVRRVVREAELTLHNVSGQFRVRQNGSTQTFVSLTEALRASLALKGWEVLPNASWADLEGQRAVVRLSLESEALPKAFFVTAIFSERWLFDTGWLDVLIPPEPTP